MLYMYMLPCELITGRCTDVSSNDSSPCNHDIVSPSLYYCLCILTMITLKLFTFCSYYSVSK